jgi:hypothetical protein
VMPLATSISSTMRRLASFRPQTRKPWNFCGIGVFAQAGADGIK